MLGTALGDVVLGATRARAGSPAIPSRAPAARPHPLDRTACPPSRSPAHVHWVVYGISRGRGRVRFTSAFGSRTFLYNVRRRRRVVEDDRSPGSIVSRGANRRCSTSLEPRWRQFVLGHVSVGPPFEACGAGAISFQNDHAGAGAPGDSAVAITSSWPVVERQDGRSTRPVLGCRRSRPFHALERALAHQVLVCRRRLSRSRTSVVTPRRPISSAASRLVRARGGDDGDGSLRPG